MPSNKISEHETNIRGSGIKLCVHSRDNGRSRGLRLFMYKNVGYMIRSHTTLKTESNKSMVFGRLPRSSAVLEPDGIRKMLVPACSIAADTSARHIGDQQIPHLHHNNPCSPFYSDKTLGRLLLACPTNSSGARIRAALGLPKLIGSPISNSARKQPSQLNKSDSATS